VKQFSGLWGTLYQGQEIIFILGYIYIAEAYVVFAFMETSLKHHFTPADIER
jgi:hypothetical protein